MKNYLVGIIVLLTVLLFAGCGSKKLTPAEFCEENGWVSSDGICLFTDGSYCETEPFVNGECEAGENVYSVVDETSILEYCVDNGWSVKVEEDASFCMFSDESYCEVGAYFNGECREWEMVYNVIEKDVENEENNEIENTKEGQEFVKELSE